METRVPARSVAATERSIALSAVHPYAHSLGKADRGQALSGAVRGGVFISTYSSGGEEAIVILLEPGEMFGDIALLSGVPRTASARSMRAVDLLQIPRDHFVPF